MALRVEETNSPDTFIVSGRGELHLAILIETMRREGYEFQVSRPEVLMRRGDNGELLEPFEDVFIETTPDTLGTVMEMLGSRRGQLLNMVDNQQGSIPLTYLVPTPRPARLPLPVPHRHPRHGHHARPAARLPAMAGELPTRSNGSLVSFEDGQTSTFGLKNAEERGTLFYGAGVDTYAGMVWANAPVPAIWP